MTAERVRALLRSGLTVRDVADLLRAHPAAVESLANVLPPTPPAAKNSGDQVERLTGDRL